MAGLLEKIDGLGQKILRKPEKNLLDCEGEKCVKRVSKSGHWVTLSIFRYIVTRDVRVSMMERMQEVYDSADIMSGGNPL
ncbi:hypothetical protein H5410_050160 [Solanum commersonii]|uniref:Uncharacterized protein n=1 Tax=Solanum commersonii TaxID=4109 RepID=A0A9J5WW94_SOLCO|nr:hypothetical protein H5410_050160 [Solanum commersonii]